MERGARRRLVASAAVLALAALGAALLAGCGGEAAEPSSPATVRATVPAKADVTVHASVGDTVIVTLDANSTTGYEWTFIGGDTFSIEESEYVPDPNPDQLAGKGGAQVVTLLVTKAGESDLLGTYARSWETPSPGTGPDTTVTIDSVQ